MDAAAISRSVSVEDNAKEIKNVPIATELLDKPHDQLSR